MAEKRKIKQSDQLSPEEARLAIKAIEEVEREEANQQPERPQEGEAA